MHNYIVKVRNTRRDEYRAKYKEKEEIEQSRKKSSQTD